MTSTRPHPRGGHGGLRLHGRRPLPGLAHRAALLRPPAQPDMQVVCGRDAERTAEAAARLGWAETETDWRRLVERDGRRPRRHLHAWRHPRRDRDRRAGGGQARAVREAAGQLGRRGRGDDRGRRAGGAARRTRDGRLHLPAGAGDRAGPPARRRGPDRRDPARPGAVPPGLDRRPRGAAVLAAGQGQGGLRRARRHRRTHRRPDPVHHRRPDHRGLRPARDLRQGAADRRPSTPGSPASAGTERGPVTVDDAAVFIARFTGGGARRLRGHPVRHRPQERDPRSRSTARPAAWPSTSRT